MTDLFNHLDWDLAFPDSKPVGDVEIDWSDPITEGLEFFTIIQDGKMVDLVEMSLATLTGNAAVAAQELSTTYSGAGLATWSGRRTIPNTVGRTVITRSNISSLNGQAFSYFLAVKGTTEFSLLLSVYQTTPSCLQITWHPAIGYLRSSTDYIDFNEWRTYGASVAPDGLSANAKLYKDGIKFTGTPAAATDGALETLNGGSIYMSGRPSGARYLNGKQSFGTFWSRQLEDEEVKRFSDNPNCFLVPRY